jgi:hypothetical protein
MNEYSFVVSMLNAFPPDSTFHLPFEGTIVLSDAAVASGIANASDILSLTITAGDAVPNSNPMTFSDLTPPYHNPKVTLSADRKTVTAITAESADGVKFNHWFLAHKFQDTPVGFVQNVVMMNAGATHVETDYMVPINPPSIYDSQFKGIWTQDKKIKIPSKNVHELAIDPLALLLPNDIYIKLHLPDPPPFEAVQEYIRRSIEAMSAEEYERAYARFKKMKGFTDDLEKLFQSRR